MSITHVHGSVASREIEKIVNVKQAEDIICNTDKVHRGTYNISGVPSPSNSG
jgi:hypothetical protein